MIASGQLAGIARSWLVLAVTGALALTAIGSAPAAAQTADPPGDDGPHRIDGGGYLDLGYLDSSTRPGNHTWRSKGTSNVLDRLKVNNATAWLYKDATSASRWGFEVGLQAGVDPESGDPGDDIAIDGAEVLRHLYTTNASYRLPWGRGLELTGGLIPGFPGYPNFHAIENPTYTRPYAVDYVPYFLWGLRATYAPDEAVSGSLFVVSGWEYLVSANDIPSYGLQFRWQVSDRVHFTQNLYYGSDQKATALQFWRFATDTNLEWRTGRFLVGASLTYGNEKQAEVAGQPVQAWTAAALWLQWRITECWRVALRPELFDDPDGLQTGARQTISAVAATAEYRLRTVDRGTLSARAELRFDRSTGEGGGFFEGPDNNLVEDQRLLILAVMWKVDTAGG